MNNRIRILIFVGVLFSSILSLPAQINKNLEAVIREYKASEAMCQPKYSRYLMNKFYEIYEDYPPDSINSILSDISFEFTPQFFLSDNDINNAQKAEDILDALKFNPHKPFSLVDLIKDNDKLLGWCHFTPLGFYRTSVYKMSDAAILKYEYIEYPPENIANRVLKQYDDDFLFFIKTESYPHLYRIPWIVSGSNFLGYVFPGSYVEDGIKCLDRFLREKDEYKAKFEHEFEY